MTGALALGLAVLVAALAWPPGHKPRREGAPMDLGPVSPYDVIALERMIPSELGSGTGAELGGLLWAVRNRAARLGTTIYRLAVGPSGTFGDIVDSAGRLTGRYFSTKRAPDPSRLPLILDVLQAPAEADPIGGADGWFEPAEADAELRQGLPGATRSADQIRADLRAGGARLVATIGRIEFWRLA